MKNSQSHKVPPYDDPEDLRPGIGLCQVKTKPFDCTGNRARALAALEKAGEMGCEIAITPECVVHGYGFLDDREELRKRMLEAAESRHGPTVKAASEIARRYSMAVAIGYAEQEDGRIYNSTTLIGRSGDIESHYRKVHLRDFESRKFGSVFDPGNEFPVVDLDLRSGRLRAGLMICFDREIPESVRSLRSKGAELVICPLACDTEPLDQMKNFAENEMVTRVRAAENEIFIAVVNHSARFNGGSFVVGPAGESIIQLGTEEDVRRVDLPIGGLRNNLRGNPFTWMGWGYRRPEVYASQCQDEPE